MKYVPLGRTGVQVSQVCLGTMNFGWKTEAELSRQIIARAVEAGVNFIDTADVYSRGRSEQLVGQAMAEMGNRDKLVLATKFHGSMSDDLNDRGNHRRHIVQACEASLLRLHTEFIDLYQVHRPQSDIPIDETLRALDDLIRSGKALYAGTSTFAAWQLCESLWVSKELGLNRFVTEQPPYNILERRVERELLPFCRTYGFGVLAWSPLAGGLLSGKYRRGQPPPAGSRFERPEEKSTFTAEMYHVIEEIRKLAEGLGCTMSQFALRWCLQQPGITSVIIGPRTMEQLEDNLKSVEIDLGTEELEQVDLLVPPGRMVSPFYEADFGPGKYTWV
jgi:aryl-alcohol dehydrogenase-like predicted oxidoreductase